MKYPLCHQKNGQSLIEVVVSIGVIVLILVGLISAITFATSNVQFSRNKAQAIKYEQEAVEWLRRQRDASWSVLYNAGSVSGRTYCFNANLTTLAVSTTTFPVPPKTCAAAPANPPISDQYNIFHREVTLTRSLADRVAVIVRVYWQQGSRTTDVLINTYLTQWQ